MKIKHTLLLFPICWLLTAGTFFYPPVNSRAQVVTQLPKITVEIEQSSKKDSVEFIKSADENTKYQNLLIAKFKNQEKQIEALKKENKLLKSTLIKSKVDIDSLLVLSTNHKKRSFFKWLHFKNKN